MITISTRPFTDGEKKILLQQMSSVSGSVENAIFVFMGLTLVGLLPLLILNRFISIPSKIQLILCISVVFISARYAYLKYWKPNVDFNAREKRQHQLDSTYAEVWHIRTTRALEREDIEDFGPSYYLEVNDKESLKTLFLWGQYLYDRPFPNTEFELVKISDTGETIDLTTLGIYFPPEKVLPPFDLERLKQGHCPNDGELLDQKLDDIK